MFKGYFITKIKFTLQIQHLFENVVRIFGSFICEIYIEKTHNLRKILKSIRFSKIFLFVLLFINQPNHFWKSSQLYSSLMVLILFYSNTFNKSLPSLEWIFLNKNLLFIIVLKN
ncbi:hypothetical protein H311_00346 [Anncaliia algerae PRA109]|nr:hypothetical protein H311_00346 [Anncaliia algerae PRA109]